MSNYIGTIDQGTTSTRFIIFDKNGNIVSTAQMEHSQIFVKPGWVEHNPLAILKNTKTVIKQAIENSNINPAELKSIGITNQRETIIAWNKTTGKPYYNAIVWQDMRGKEILDKLLTKQSEKYIHQKTGLIAAPYFSASKIKWLYDNVKEFKSDAKKGEAIVGTIDTWLLWNLSKDSDGAHPHLTDVTNASRYMLMDIKNLCWDEKLLELFGLPLSIFPKIVPSIPRQSFSTGVINTTRGKATLNFSGILGDQQSALFGQACFYKGESKCTYGTGGFLLMNTGAKPILSKNGLLTTIAYQKEGEAPVYALEGSVAVAGSLVQWIRDNLNLINSAKEIDICASKVEDSGDVYFVPAFAGLFAPHWQASARGVICGLTGYATKNHICRAALESTALQVTDLFSAILKDSAIDLPRLKVDGGMSVSAPLMQMQADFLGVEVVRPKIVETTALGAAYCAGLTSGFWKDFKDLAKHQKIDKSWSPKITASDRESKLSSWKKAINKSLNWVETI